MTCFMLVHDLLSILSFSLTMLIAWYCVGGGDREMGEGWGATGRYPDNPPDNPKFIGGEMQDFASVVNLC